MDIYDKVNAVDSQKEFVDFLTLFLKDFRENRSEWENADLESFLYGMIGYCSDKKIEVLDWKNFGEILLASKVYE